MNRKHLAGSMWALVFAVVGVMALGVSTAQAKWLLLKSGVSVLSMQLNASIPLTQLLVPGLSLEIHCTFGTGTASVSLNEGHAKLTGTFKVIATLCSDSNYGEVCDVGSVGEEDGVIALSGTGNGGMGGTGGEEEYFLDAGSNEFTNITYRGEECPLTEIDGRVSGKVRIDLLGALTDTGAKIAHLLDKGLSLGEEEAEMHSGAVSVTEATGATFGVHLVGL